MDGIEVKIEGFDDCAKMFDLLPDNMVKMEKVAMRKASAAVSRMLRKGIPSRFKKLIKYKMHEDRRRNNYVLIGLYNRKEIAGQQPADFKPDGSKNDPVFDWFKAYWKNYGTLSKRDPSHKFKFDIKPITKGNPRRQSVGQSPERFFEKALEGWQEVYLEAFEKEMEKQENTLYDR